VDATRFFLTSEVSFGNDGDFSDKAMTLKVNSALANSLGNLCQRVLTLIYKNCDQAVPKVGPYSEADEALLSTTRSLRGKCDKAMSDQTIQKYVDTLILMIVDANKYIDEMAPWVLRKTDTARMATVLYVLMEVLRFTAILYQPVIPDSAGRILDALSVPKDERTFMHLDDVFRIKEGSHISKPEPIFPRIELPMEELVESSS
jgi:methionyl-tRNA synthetase